MSNTVKEKRMKQVTDESRRQLLKKLTLGMVLVPIAGATLRRHCR